MYIYYISTVFATIVETLLARWGIKEDVDHMHSLKKYAPLERSNQCNICFITSLFLTPIIIIMNTVNTQYIYFCCGNILKEKNMLVSCEEKCDWGIQAEPSLPLNGLLMIITIILSILWSSASFSLVSKHSLELFWIIWNFFSRMGKAHLKGKNSNCPTAYHKSWSLYLNWLGNPDSSWLFDSSQI